MDIVGNRTLRDLLREREHRFGDKTFLVFVEKDGSAVETSYRGFVEQVRRVAAGFADRGIGKGDKVVVQLPNCPEFLLCWFGLAWIGAVVVPANSASTATEMRHVVSFSDAVAVVTDEERREALESVVDELPAVRLRVLLTAAQGEWLPFANLLASEPTPPEVPLNPDDVAELLFTSGTTARPKAVMLTHGNCLYAGEREWRILGLVPEDRCLTALPAFHVNAQTVTILSSLTVGATCVLLAEYSASRFWEHVRARRATALSLVAMQVRTLLAQPKKETDKRHSVRRVMYAINVLDEEKAEFESRYAVELTNGYGLSEAMTIVTIAPVHGERRWPSIGLPTLDRQVRIVDEDGVDVAKGRVGEIIVSGVPGRTLMAGYYEDPKATADALRDGWLYTGDNGYFDERGYVHFFDRRKDVIKVAGENVSASEVEHVLLTCPGVVEAAVVSVAHSIRDEVPVAFVVLEPGADVTTEDVKEYCAGHMAKFKVPWLVEVLDGLPKTSIGKIEKKVLREATLGWGPL
ncbi:ATP-dependent acyl-CoA ligase [Prauserella marina]|uniref:Crotonobetaine/carnitine-CoA ligase n=1 Tax=Prauserella marina TaxID=530584 RepID=A0A222VTZ6_9PSEU|nr:AMP-binding protein [Prauserella marina]ASR37397.1 ATP-dependent acyl-CoA ligase [Prauserella marina]PWV74728.1 crotonobetaine/carnitine-CoA ligase [Prauserella marina]SDD42269.1 crotonobetaine/carnitine-CoA ligase [Prauserella marina]